MTSNREMEDGKGTQYTSFQGSDSWSHDISQYSVEVTTNLEGLFFPVDRHWMDFNHSQP